MRYSYPQYLFVVALVLSGGCRPDENQEAFVQSVDDGDFNTLFLDQGWNESTRRQVSYTSFGSRIIPRHWFLALEQHDNTSLFRTNEHLAALGFIIESPHEFNPDGLPVGFSAEQNEDGDYWIGLTCAACHTGQVNVQGKSIRIDGGQALIDFARFEQNLLAALKATQMQPEKFERFASAVLSIKPEKFASNLSDLERLKHALETRVKQLEHRAAGNKTPVAYGHGRLDAFGQIFNAIAYEALDIPENARVPDAPTSFPVLWDASHLDVVQWNASAPNKEPGPLFQNATTALAVYGTVQVQDHSFTYPSSINIKNLGYLQREFYKLVSPPWPKTLAGELNSSLVQRGASLYRQHCIECHALVDSSDPKRKLRAVVTPLAELGTDSKMAENFFNATVKTGPLDGKKRLVAVGKKFTEEAASIDVVMHVVTGALLRHPLATTKAIFTEYQSNYSATDNAAQLNYKARPINGIWASAPYLHNGSVPTIYDLLLPANQRPKEFYVGNFELDIKKIGYLIEPTSHSSFFDTRLIGNSNSGHEFGTELNDADRWAMVEYIKSL